MITRLIARTLTPIVSKSRVFRLHGARAVVSNRPYLDDLAAPTRYRCHTTLLVKQGANGLPFYFRAHLGYLHVDIKTRTPLQARRRLKSLLQLRWVGQLTKWGYGVIQWLLQKSFEAPEAPYPSGPRFRILKGLPPLSSHEKPLVMAALPHDLVDTPYHPSKLGCSLRIPNLYVRWLCEHHHTTKEHQTTPDLRLLQEADMRTSRYARLLLLPTRRRQFTPTNTKHLTIQLQQAALHSVYQLYSVIYYSQALRHLTASKAHPTESLRNHLIGVANWTLFLLRTRPSSPHLPASAALAGQPGATPGPVETKDPRTNDEPFASW